MGGSLNGVPNKVETFEPAIRRSFIPYLMPIPLLGIKARLNGGRYLRRRHVCVRIKSSISSPLCHPARSTYSHIVKPRRWRHRCFRHARNPSRFPWGHRIIPRRPNRGATHPNRFKRSRCWLVVGTRNRLPRFAHPIPRRGCKVNPVSSSKTMVSFGPRCRSFF